MAKTASGIVTNTHLTSPDNEWYTTVSEDEVIAFVDDVEGKLRNVNSATVFANGTVIKFSLCRVDNAINLNLGYVSDKMYVGIGANLENTNVESFNAIKVYGAAGQEIKFINNWI